MKRWLILAWVAAGLAALALTAANLVLGDLNQDEGWYLYAARLVSEGAIPYRDFAYTQTPLMPLVYAPAQKLFAAWGVAGGRAFTAALGWLGALLAAWLAARLLPEHRRAASLLTFALIAVNVYQNYYTTVVKTYALTALCLLAGFLALTMALERRHRAGFAMAGALMALAVGTRSSAAMAPLAVLVVLWLARRRAAPPGAWLSFMLGGAVAGAALLLPFFIMAPENFWFNVVSYHTARDAGLWPRALVYKAGFLSRMLQAYFTAFAMLALALIRVERPTPDAGRPATPMAPGRLAFLALWPAVIGITLLHMLAPFPYDDYQAFAYPLFCVGVAVFAINRLAGSAAGAGRLALIGLLISGAAAISSPMNQDWFIQGRDRIWWKLKDQPPLVKLREAGRLIAASSAPDALLLTQDPYLAVEANRRLPPGMELGQFCYFPGLTTAEARRRRVLNRETMVELLQNCDAPVAALSGYAFAMESPSIQPVPDADQRMFHAIITGRYQLLREIEHFGQASTTLKIFTRASSANQMESNQ